MSYLAEEKEKQKKELLKEVEELMRRYYPDSASQRGGVKQVNVYFENGVSVHVREDRETFYWDRRPEQRGGG